VMNFVLSRKLGLGCGRSYSSIGPVVLTHELPQDQINRKYYLPKSQIVQAKSLIKENPIEWTPTKLAQRFDVPIPVIQAHVHLPTRRMIRTFRQFNSDLSTPYNNRYRTPQQQVVDSWILAQMAKIPETKRRKKQWRIQANQERENIDLPWLLQLEKKMSLLQEKALIQLETERKERREKGGVVEKSGILDKKAGK